MADDVYGENLLKMRAIYDMLKLVKADKKTDDKRRFNPKKATRSANLLRSVGVVFPGEELHPGDSPPPTLLTLPLQTSSCSRC